ncbi:MAG: hypothetical protein LBD45_00205 [Bacteroidales bacterium]|nr:hypothetical protein [Bacteroidales bacterium]
MKTVKYIFMLIVGTAILQSCELNELPGFDDGNAFVSFPKPVLSIGENKETMDVAVLLTSQSGLSGTVAFEVIDTLSTAVEGVNYRILNESNVLTFTKDGPTQYIRLELIDNNTFDGDVKLTFALKDPSSGLSLGFEKTATLTITDDEHPLLFILGRMEAKGESYYNGEQTWNPVFAKDESDIFKVWITGLVAGGSSASTPVYGTVSTDKTEIRIPVNQIVALSSSYPLIRLEGFYGDEGDDPIPDGGYITGEIAEDGTITLIDWFGSHVYSDANATTALGWYNIFSAGVTIKKVE